MAHGVSGLLLTIIINGTRSYGIATVIKLVRPEVTHIWSNIWLNIRSNIHCLEPDTQVVAIEEIQFFDAEIVDVVRSLLEADIRVVFAGLSLDFRGEPFGSMPTLLSLCDEIEKPTAVCTETVDGKPCGAVATKTQRLINGKPANYSDPIVLIGDEEEGYHARCPKHHRVPGKPTPKPIYQSK